MNMCARDGNHQMLSQVFEIGFQLWAELHRNPSWLEMAWGTRHRDEIGGPYQQLVLSRGLKCKVSLKENQLFGDHLNVDEEKLKFVDHFTWLDSCVDNDGCLTAKSVHALQELEMPFWNLEIRVLRKGPLSVWKILLTWPQLGPS